MSDPNQEPKALSIARLAVHLLPPGAPTLHDSREVSEAVALASRIIEQASKAPAVRAYQLFPTDAELGIHEIKDIFKSCDWQKLQSYSSVADQVRDLLEAMHRDIEVRRALVATAFRNKSLRIDPEEAEHEACTAIKTLLRNLGMDFLIAHRLDDVACRVWHDLVETWLLGDRHLRNELAKRECASASLFTAVCVDSSYEDYTEARRPPKDLHAADGLIAVILWINTNLRSRLGGAGNQEDVVDELFKLNFWPEFLCPNDRHISKPFAECIAGLSADPVEQQALLEKFDLGVQRFSLILGRLMLVEFSKKFSTEALLLHQCEIKSAWDDQEEGEKESLSEMLVGDPSRTIECISSFLRGEMPYFPMRQPFHGNGIPSPILRPYAQYLDMLLYSLREMRQLAHHLRVKDEFQEAEDAIRAEKSRIIEMGEELEDMENNATQEKIGRGEELVKTLESKFNPGKINAHLLFRYAAERGLKEDLLVKNSR